MKIVRYFNDYYDGCLSFGQDDRLIYVRKTEEADLPPASLGYQHLVHHRQVPSDSMSTFRNSSDQQVIIFCGKAWVVRRVRTFDEKTYMHHDAFYYSLEQFERDYPPPEESKTQNFHVKRRQMLYNRWMGKSEKETGLLFPKVIEPLDVPGLEDWCIANKVLVARHYPAHGTRDTIFEKNPRLADVEFFRALDPVTAFQTLSMWMGGVISQSENNIVKIADKDRIVQHGFDQKSFRKGPTKHR